jgi:5'-nucleotidase/UDP-sugar diphosphatase
VEINGQPLAEQMDESFTVAFNTYISLGGFGESWNGKPIGGGVAGDIPSMDLRQLTYLDDPHRMPLAALLVIEA